jgi:hypothetical protein
MKTQVGFDVEHGLRWEKADGQFWKYITLPLDIFDKDVSGLDEFTDDPDVEVDQTKATLELLEFAKKHNFDPDKHYKAYCVDQDELEAALK